VAGTTHPTDFLLLDGGGKVGVTKVAMKSHHYNPPPLAPPTRGGEILVGAFVNSGSVEPIRVLNQRKRVYRELKGA